MPSPAPRSSSTSADARPAGRRWGACSSRCCSSARGPASATPSSVRRCPSPCGSPGGRALGADGGAARRRRPRCAVPGWSAPSCRCRFATLAAYASGGTALAPFLLAAPLAPVLGVAAAYGPRQDPLEALIATAPYGRTRLILLRTIGVLVSVLPVTVLLGLAVPGPPWLAAAWLGPALALVPVLLALAAFVGPRTAATVVSLVLVRRRARLDACLRADLAGRGRTAGRLPRAGRGRLRRHRDPGRHRPAAGGGVVTARAPSSSPASASGTAAPAPSPTSTSPSTEASPGCSAPTAPARRRCCASSPPRSPPTAARCGCSGATRTAPTPT